MTAENQYTRECVALELGSHFRGQDVAAVLTRASPLPAASPPRSTSTTARSLPPAPLITGSYANQVQLDFGRPGKPTDNATIAALGASGRERHRMVRRVLRISLGGSNERRWRSPTIPISELRERSPTRRPWRPC
jgi:putative transposase